MIDDFKAINQKSDDILNIDRNNIVKKESFDTSDYWSFTLSQIEALSFDDNVIEPRQISLLKHNINALIIRNKSYIDFIKDHPIALKKEDGTELYKLTMETLKNNAIHYDSFIQKTNESFSHIYFLLVMNSRK